MSWILSCSLFKSPIACKSHLILKLHKSGLDFNLLQDEKKQIHLA